MMFATNAESVNVWKEVGKDTFTFSHKENLGKLKNGEIHILQDRKPRNKLSNHTEPKIGGNKLSNHTEEKQ